MLDVKSIPKLLGRKALFVILSALLMVAAMLFGARVVEADSIWHQSYQRGSESEACVAQTGETPWEDSWGTNPGWSPSWEQWANSGQGGWVCSRSITWAQKAVPASSSSGGSSSVTYALGDTGPGGGLVFYIDSASGLRYEMAPKNWSAGSGGDPTSVWTTNAPFCFASGSITDNQNCQTNNLYPETTAGAQTASATASTAIGMGSVNTAAIKARMDAGSVSSSAYAAGLASAYAGVDGLTTDWFLPSKDELNEMWLYSRVVGFDTATYGFAGDIYWNSSQIDADAAWNQRLDNGDPIGGSKVEELRVRPIRAF